MCGVAENGRTGDLNVTGSRSPLASSNIRCVMLVNTPNKLNLLLWLLRGDPGLEDFFLI